MSELTATNLKNALWDTLKGIKDGSVQPAQGDAIAAQGREILRTVKVQLQVMQQSKRSVPMEVIAFAEKLRACSDLGVTHARMRSVRLK